jgi:hypothetical protein
MRSVLITGTSKGIGYETDRPVGKVSRTEYPEINRCLTHEEFQRAIEVTREAGLFRLDGRSALRAAMP